MKMVGSINVGGLLLLSVMTSYSTEAAVLVFVSPATGKDTTECLSQQLQQTDDYSSYSACATLDYVLEGIHHLMYRNVSIVLNATNSDDLQSSAYYVSCSRTVTTWNKMDTFELTGYGGIAHIECAEDTGFAFSNSSNIRLVNMSIKGCALIQNSTSTDSESMNPGSLMKYKQFFVAVYFLLCDTVTLDHVTVSGTKGVALVLYGTGGVNTISSCKFFNNTSGKVGGAYNDSTSGSLQGGGGIAIEFVYCIPGDVNCNQESGSAIPSSRYSNVSFRIIDCKFLNNYGQISENSSEDAFIIPNKNHNIALGRGGGLGIVFKGKAINNRMVIDSCDFIANEALWGGGALFEFQDNAQDNVIQVKSTKFISNKCHYSACDYTGTGGGGVRVLFAGFDSLVKNNSVLFSDVKFESNEAYFGGGTSLMTFPEIEQTTNAVTFSNVTWINNTARVGSAVDLSVWHLTFNGSVIRPVFLDSTFQTNTIHYTQSTGVAEGAGTIYADTVPIAFSGNTTFQFNIGSCVYVVEADVEFLDGSYTEFKNNTADSGAAISLHGNSYMLLSNGSDIVFASNTADLYGGAINWIAAGNRFLISSRNCFIRYKDYLLDPKKWPVLLTFDNNHAGITGDDIFGTTLLGCLWGGQPFGNFSHQQKEYSEVFNWSSSIWYYRDGDRNSIATSPGYFVSGANKTASEQCSTSNSYSLEAIPGSYAGFNTITMNNDKQSSTPADALVFAVISSTLKSSNENKSAALSVQYVSPSNDMLVNGSENEVRHYTISTLYPRIISSKVTLTFSMCPLGFMPAHNNETCIGGNYLNLRTHTNFSISLQRGYWIGRGNNNRTVTAQCFFCPFNKNISHLTDSENYILISDTTGSNTRVQDRINHILCDGLNRVGNFCETCKPNYSPAITSDDYKCVKCDSSEVKYAWIIYILRKFLPITIALFLVILFGVSVTSGPANSFVLFAQVISTTFAVNVGQTLDYTSIIKGGYYSPDYMRKVYISLYSIWNLDFFESINGHTCLGQNISTLNLLSFKYITACYPLLILLIIAILIKMYDNGFRVILCLFQPFHRLFTRCIRAFDINQSIMDAFATFLVLSYVKFAVTSALLLYPLRFTGEDGKTVGEPVSFFQPSINFWSKSYAPYLAVSLVIFVFICFCLPVVLFLYSLRPFYSFLEDHRRLQFLVPGEKFKLFLNSFHHCYKDGRDGHEHDRRYFCSFYFFARLLLIFAYSYSSSWIVQLIVQQVICTIAIAVVSIFQPYKNQFYNIVDSLMFSILAVINTLTLYQIYLATAKSGLSLTCYCIQVIFVFIPILYILGFVSQHVYLKCHQRVQKQRNNNNFENDDVSRNFSYGEFMQEVQNEGRFEQMNPSPIEEEERNAYVNVHLADPSGGGQQCSQTTVSVIDEQLHDLRSTEEQQQQETKHRKRRACTTTGLRSKQQRLRHKRNTNPTSARSELVPLLH